MNPCRCRRGWLWCWLDQILAIFEDTKYRGDSIPDAHFVEFEWAEPVMPSHVGPFASRADAEKWVESRQFKDASWEIIAMKRPT